MQTHTFTLGTKLIIRKQYITAYISVLVTNNNSIKLEGLKPPKENHAPPSRGPRPSSWNESLAASRLKTYPAHLPSRWPRPRPINSSRAASGSSTQNSESGREFTHLLTTQTPQSELSSIKTKT